MLNQWRYLTLFVPLLTLGASAAYGAYDYASFPTIPMAVVETVIYLLFFWFYFLDIRYIRAIPFGWITMVGANQVAGKLASLARSPAQPDNIPDLWYLGCAVILFKVYLVFLANHHIKRFQKETKPG